jgi:hypothetical protein
MRDGIQAFAITWYGTVMVSAIGLVAFVSQFRRLEALGDGRHRPSAVATAADVPLAGYQPSVQRNWIWLVVKKELRLQQMTLAVSGLYVLVAAVIMIVTYKNPLYVGPTFGAVSMLHGYFIAVIAGSMASAEERHMGTLSGQILQPQNAWLQWALKSGVTLGLTLALAILLPLALMAIHRPVDAFRVKDDYILAVALLGAGAMFVSSVSSNSLWALLASFPVIGGAVLIGGAVIGTLQRSIMALLPYDWTRSNALWKTDRAAFNTAMQRYIGIRDMVDAFFVVAAIGAGILVLYFAARHHRSLERNGRVIARQAGMLLLYTTVAAILYYVIPRYFSPFR